MTPAATALAGLRSQRPEWAPWLAVVEEALRDIGHRAWDAAVPRATHATGTTTPLLMGVEVAVDVRAVRDLLRRVIGVASHGGTPQMATLRAVVERETDLRSLFKASICHDSATTAAAATSCGADLGALDAVMALLAVPFLQACRQQWAPVLCRGWLEGYCRVCGTWPAFAEVRGIERRRMFRCGRCGDEWHARPLRCPYCGMDDHTTLVSLVPEMDGSNAVIEGCKSCRGYLKTFTRLQGCLPGAVMLDDLGSVHLDVAAIEQGYARPSGPGYRLNLTIASD